MERLRKQFETHRPRFIVLAARGTSDNAAQFGRYLLEITTGIPVSLAAPSVYTLYKAHVDCKTRSSWLFRNPENPRIRILSWSARMKQAR